MTTKESSEQDENVNPDKGQPVSRFIVCILAHVDHGKTSVADSLLAMAGIVNPNLVADTRYLDNRPDEQAKGITMKSSVFSLMYQPSERKYIFTVVDTPGHIDFSKEVSSVVKSCDGAIIVVDVVEGILAQTREAIKIAMNGGLKMILLINKYDRLIINKKQSFDETCFSILRILESTNDVLVEIFEERLKVRTKDDETRKNQAIIMAKNHVFAFEKDNVIIGSSLDGWGILPRDMLKLFLPNDDKMDAQSKKNLENKVMAHFCDLDYYYSSHHTVRQGAIKKGYDSMFMVMVVKTLYHVYDTLMGKKDIAEVEKITRRLKIENITSEMRSSSSRTQLRSIMRSFASLGETIMRAAIIVVPEARDVPLMRMRQMIRETVYLGDGNNLEQIAQMMSDLEFSRRHLNDSSTTKASSHKLATYGYISKLISVKQSDITAPDSMKEKLLKKILIASYPALGAANDDFIPEMNDPKPNSTDTAAIATDTAPTAANDDFIPEMNDPKPNSTDTAAIATDTAPTAANDDFIPEMNDPKPSSTDTAPISTDPEPAAANDDFIPEMNDPKPSSTDTAPISTDPEPAAANDDFIPEINDANPSSNDTALIATDPAPAASNDDFIPEMNDPNPSSTDTAAIATDPAPVASNDDFIPEMNDPNPSSTDTAAIATDPAPAASNDDFIPEMNDPNPSSTDTAPIATDPEPAASNDDFIPEMNDPNPSSTDTAAIATDPAPAAANDDFIPEMNGANPSSNDTALIDTDPEPAASNDDFIPEKNDPNPSSTDTAAIATDPAPAAANDDFIPEMNDPNPSSSDTAAIATDPAPAAANDDFIPEMNDPNPSSTDTATIATDPAPAATNDDFIPETNDPNPSSGCGDKRKAPVCDVRGTTSILNSPKSIKMKKKIRSKTNRGMKFRINSAKLKLNSNSDGPTELAQPSTSNSSLVEETVLEHQPTVFQEAEAGVPSTNVQSKISGPKVVVEFIPQHFGYSEIMAGMYQFPVPKLPVLYEDSSDSDESVVTPMFADYTIDEDKFISNKENVIIQSSTNTCTSIEKKNNQSPVKHPTSPENLEISTQQSSKVPKVTILEQIIILPGEISKIGYQTINQSENRDILSCGGLNTDLKLPTINVVEQHIIEPVESSSKLEVEMNDQSAGQQPTLSQLPALHAKVPLLQSAIQELHVDLPVYKNDFSKKKVSPLYAGMLLNFDLDTDLLFHPAVIEEISTSDIESNTEDDAVSSNVEAGTPSSLTLNNRFSDVLNWAVCDKFEKPGNTALKVDDNAVDDSSLRIEQNYEGVVDKDVDDKAAIQENTETVQGRDDELVDKDIKAVVDDKVIEDNNETIQEDDETVEETDKDKEPFESNELFIESDGETASKIENELLDISYDDTEFVDSQEYEEVDSDEYENIRKKSASKLNRLSREIKRIRNRYGYKKHSKIRYYYVKQRKAKYYIQNVKYTRKPPSTADVCLKVFEEIVSTADNPQIDTTDAGPTDNGSEVTDKVFVPTVKAFETTDKCLESIDKFECKNNKFADGVPLEFRSNLRSFCAGDEEPLVTIAIIRIFFGRIQMGDHLTLLQSAYKPPIRFDNKEKSMKYNEKYIREFQINEMYILNGRDIILTDKASAGCICGIRFDHTSKDGHLLRTGTIVNNVDFYAIYELPLLDPVLSVCVAPRFAKHMQVLSDGLTWLQNTDPSVKVRLQENGQYVILATGDVHLSKLTTDLSNYVKIELKFEDPIVSFRETMINPKEDDVGKTIAALQKLRHSGELKEFKLFIELYVMNLPYEISYFIEENIEILKLIEDTYDWGYIRKRFAIEAGMAMRKSVNKIFDTLQMESHYTLLQENFKTIVQKIAKENQQSKDTSCEFSAVTHSLLARNIWSVGHLGMPETSNLLINKVNRYKRSIFYTIDETDRRSLIDSCIVKAFNETIKSGPICGEPLANCGFVITDFNIDSYKAIMASDIAISTITSQITNACITAMKEAFLKQKVQLMEPMFETEISLMSSEQSESVMTIVKGRKGKVITATDIPDEPSTFRAYIPALQCVDFADAVRNITSGYANPYLRFKKFEIVEGDPMDATADEEQNPAYEICTIVRKRKGLHAGDEVVEKGEKQKTLSKKK